MMKNIEQECEHLNDFTVKYRAGNVCEECVKTGDTWVHLRTCQSCGATLCCDSSINKHSSKHSEKDGHAVIISAEPGEYWAYCFEDDQFVEMEAYDAKR